MQRISQVGALAAQFGATLTALADVAESEMQEVFKNHEQDEATLKIQHGVELAAMVQSRDDMHQHVIRAGQQLGKAANEITELKTKLGEPKSYDADLIETATQLAIDLRKRTANVAHPDQLLTRMESLLAMIVPAKADDAEGPKLSVVAEAVADRESQPATDTAS